MNTHFALCTLLCLGGLIACQPAPEEEDSKPKPHEPAVLNYTMLGIWPDRVQAYAVTEKLGEAGIRSQLSGHQPCIINVEAAKLEHARAIAASNP